MESPGARGRTTIFFFTIEGDGTPYRGEYHREKDVQLGERE